MSLLDRILAGDVRALARAASLMERQSEEGLALSRRLAPHTGRALTVGITGPPGAGKSTLVDALIGAFRQQNITVGVLAIDPSSPFSQGALLGDRVRMLSHYSDPGVFIRSMATRGRLGGVAATTLDLSMLLDAAGWQVVLIETVGVGQAEWDIAHLARVTVLVLAPGSGDDIQALKAGILEAASVIAINKSDLPGADRLAEDIVEAQHLSSAPAIPVCRISAIGKQGIVELLTHIEAASRVPSHESWIHRLRQNLLEEMMASLPSDLLHQHAKRISEKMEDLPEAVAALKAYLLKSFRDAN